MIQQITIKNFRGIVSEDLELKPLTLLTGLNSTGKSTCFQAILAILYHNGKNANILLSSYDLSFATNRNRNVNAKSIFIEVKFDNKKHINTHINDEIAISETTDEVDLEDSVYYLSANRLAYDLDTEAVSSKFKVGIQGEYIYGTFESEKSNQLDASLIKDKESETLSAQLN